MNWDDLRLFRAVAKAGGLAPAARETGSSPPTLSRRMLALEAALGLDLFERQARGYALTSDGRALLERTDVMADLVDGARAEPGPKVVRVSAGRWTLHHIARNIGRIGGDGIRLHLIGTEERADFLHRDAAIGIRNARPIEAALAGQRLSSVHFAPYAAEAGGEGWIAVALDTPSARWTREQGDIAIETTSPHVALELARAGAGRLVLPEFIGEAEPGLRRAGARVAALSHDRWLVSHHEMRHEPQVRRVLTGLRRVLT